MKFCKVFEFGDDQLLIKKVTENDGGEPAINSCMWTPLGEVAIERGYPTEEARDRLFDAVDAEQAALLYQQLKDTAAQFEG